MHLEAQIRHFTYVGQDATFVVYSHQVIVLYENNHYVPKFSLNLWNTWMCIHNSYAKSPIVLEHICFP